MIVCNWNVKKITNRFTDAAPKITALLITGFSIYECVLT